MPPIFFLHARTTPTQVAQSKEYQAVLLKEAYKHALTTTTSLQEKLSVETSLRATFRAKGMSASEIEKAFEETMLSPMTQHRTDIRAQANADFQRLHDAPLVLPWDVIKGDSNKREPVQKVFVEILNRSKSIWQETPEAPTDPMLFVCDYQLFYIVEILMLFNNPNFHPGGHKMLVSPGAWHKFGQGNSALVFDMCSKMMEALGITLSESKTKGRGGICWQLADYLISVGFARVVADLVKFYHRDIAAREILAGNNTLICDQRIQEMRAIFVTQSASMRVQLSALPPGDLSRSKQMLWADKLDGLVADLGVLLDGEFVPPAREEEAVPMQRNDGNDDGEGGDDGEDIGEHGDRGVRGGALRGLVALRDRVIHDFDGDDDNEEDDAALDPPLGPIRLAGLNDADIMAATGPVAPMAVELELPLSQHDINTPENQALLRRLYTIHRCEEFMRKFRDSSSEGAAGAGRMDDDDEDADESIFSESLFRVFDAVVDPVAFAVFVKELDLPHLTLYLEVSHLYTMGMDGLRNGDDEKIFHADTLFSALYCICNKFNYMPLILFCRAVRDSLDEVRRAAMNVLDHVGAVIGHLTGIDELLEMTLNLMLKQKYKHLSLDQIRVKLGNLSFINARLDEANAMSANARSELLPLRQLPVVRPTRAGRRRIALAASGAVAAAPILTADAVASEGAQVPMEQRYKASWRNIRALKKLYSTRHGDNDIAAHVNRNLIERRSQVAGAAAPRPVVMYNVDLTVKDAAVTGAERTFWETGLTVLHEAFRRVRGIFRIAGDTVVPEGEVAPICTPFGVGDEGKHIIGETDRLLTDDMQAKHLLAVEGNQTNNQILRRRLKRGDAASAAVRIAGIELSLLGCHTLVEPDKKRVTLVSHDAITAASMIFKSLRVPCSLDRLHQGFRQPHTLAASLLDSASGATHIMFHQNFLMSKRIALQGRGNGSIQLCSINVLRYILKVVVASEGSIEEILVCCHNGQRIEQMGNNCKVSSIIMPGTAVLSPVLKKMATAILSAEKKAEIMKRDEFYQYVLTHLVENFSALYREAVILERGKDVDYVDKLKRAASRTVLVIENHAQFEWSVTDVYESHSQDGHRWFAQWNEEGMLIAPGRAEDRANIDAALQSDSCDATFRIVSYAYKLLRDRQGDVQIVIVDDDAKSNVAIMMALIDDDDRQRLDGSGRGILGALDAGQIALTYWHSNLCIQYDRAWMQAVRNCEYIEDGVDRLSDRLLALAAISTLWRSDHTLSLSMFCTALKKPEFFLEGLKQSYRYSTSNRVLPGYKECFYFRDATGGISLNWKAVYSMTAFFFLKANHGTFLPELFRTVLLTPQLDDVRQPQELIETIFSTVQRFHVNDPYVPAGVYGSELFSRTVVASLYHMAEECNFRGANDLPVIVRGGGNVGVNTQFNTIEFWHNDAPVRAVVVTPNVFLLKAPGVSKLIVDGCGCVTRVCHWGCVCTRTHRLCSSMCARHAKLIPREFTRSTDVADMEAARAEFAETAKLITRRLVERRAVEFRYPGCAYYGQVPRDLADHVTEEGPDAEMDGDEEGLLTARQLTDADDDRDVVSAYEAGSCVAIFERPTSERKGKAGAKITPVARGVITARIPDKQQYEAGRVAKLTPSRKEVRVHAVEATSLDKPIPYIRGYRDQGATFREAFPTTTNFCIMVPEAYLKMDMTEETGGVGDDKESDEDEVGGGGHDSDRDDDGDGSGTAVIARRSPRLASEFTEPRTDLYHIRAGFTGLDSDDSDQEYDNDGPGI
jgi:hypothetical protein